MAPRQNWAREGRSWPGRQIPAPAPASAGPLPPEPPEAPEIPEALEALEALGGRPGLGMSQSLGQAALNSKNQNREAGQARPPQRAFSETGLEKLFLFPDKLKALRAGLRTTDPLYPVSVELSLTNRCDQSCRWCSDASIRARLEDNLSLPVLERLFSDLGRGGTRGVTVEGGGEPLLSPLFSETARLIRKNGLAAGLLTNGLNLFQPEGSHGRRGPKGPGPEILSLFQWIRISLDAYDADSYRRAKGGDGFRKVLANIERLSALCPRPVVGVGYVLCSINDRPEGLLELARKLRQAGADYLAVRPVVDHPELASQMDPGQFRALLGQPLPVSLEALAHNRSEGNLGLPCLAHSLSAVITADGSVYLCGRLYGEAETEPLGNLAQSDFREIWAGQVREEQARALRDGEYCRKRCPQCRMTKYNRLLDGLRRLQTPDFI